MKKLFLLLTALAMSLSATMYAVPYLPDAEDAASSYLFDDNGQISGRNNAPQTAATRITFTWDEYYSSVDVQENGTRICRKYSFRRGGEQNAKPQLMIVINFVKENGIYPSDINALFPPYGTYTMRWDNGSYKLSSSDIAISYTYFGSSSTDNCYTYESGGTYTDHYNGNIKISAGANGKPYIVVTVTSYYDNGNYGSSAGDLIYTIGSPAAAGTIRTEALPAEGGSTSPASQYGAGGSTVDLSATPNDGYAFLRWQDEDGNIISTTASTEVSISGDATYTAVFAPARTITAQVADGQSSYGSVSGGGSYAEGATAALTATANSGYQFVEWKDANGNTVSTSSSYSFTVGSSNATYTAYFEERQQTHDFEEHFTWENDKHTDCGQKYKGGSGGNSNKYFVLRTKVMKNTNTYPGIQMDIITSQSTSGSNGYKSYNEIKFPMPGSYTNTTSSIANNRGYIVTSANNNSTTYSTQFYDANGTSYTFQNGTIKYIAPVTGQTYPFVHVDGTFGGKTVWVTIGTAPTYAINLNSQRSGTRANDEGTTSVTATYTENTNLTFAITIPTMTGYTFGGYWTTNGGTGTQVIDAEGNFIAGASGYTDALKRWLKSENVTLYAKWTANPYAVTFTAEDATAASAGCSVTGAIKNGAAITSGENQDYDTELTFTSSDATGYEIDYWTNNGTKITGSDGKTSINYTVGTTNVIKAVFKLKTYTITWMNEDGTSTLETDNAQAYGTATAYNGSTPTKTVTGYTYTFDGWATEANGEKVYNNGATPTVGGAATYYAHFRSEINSYTIEFNTNGGSEVASITQDYNTTVTAPANPTKAGYDFNSWSPAVPAKMPAENITCVAQWSPITYTITYNGLEGATNTNPTSYTIESETITLADPGARSGYTFAGWTDDDNGNAVVTSITAGTTSNRHFTANWTAVSANLVLKDGVTDGQTDIDFDVFAATYNGQTMNSVTLNRTFTAGNWSTLCLPFNATLNVSTLKGNVVEFQHAEGSADSKGDGLYLYFTTATQIVAGRAYLVRFSKAPESNSYTFTGFDGVKIDTDRDEATLADLVAANTGENANQTEGTISLIGTLRPFVLPTPSTNYMALYQNQIYYPGTRTTVPAYRAFFYDSDPSSVQQRVRIVVDGVDMGELEVMDNGELLDATSPRKYIKNGVLLIERNGVTYDAQGKRM